ncbi:MAG TPA: porin [Gammaproteobacteria bacterium]|nr:porin [Gammaproteobacteria bacterium]
MGRVILGFGLLAGGLLATGAATAAGFKVNEQSAEVVGNAMAGDAARSESASDLFFNPAASGFMNRPQISVVGSGIFPHFHFQDGRATTAAGTPVPGINSTDGKVDSFVPALYGVLPLDLNLSAGLAITSPWGLSTNYRSDWIGRYYALNSKLRTVNITPSLAWRPLPNLSLGLGFQAQYAKADLSNAIDFGTLGAAARLPGALPGRQDGKARVKGQDWGYGFTAGIQYHFSSATEIGLTYRSRIKHKLDGTARFELDSAGVGATLQGATGAFRKSDANAELITPETISLAIQQRIGSAWTVMASATHTRWSRFDELRVRFDNPAQPDNVSVEDWNNATMYSLGVSYSPSPVWTWRAGIAFDESPVPTKTRTPRVPDSDRYWLALGASYQPTPQFALHAAYVHIWVEDADIRLLASDPGNAARGSLFGHYESRADVVALQADWRF